MLSFREKRPQETTPKLKMKKEEPPLASLVSFVFGPFFIVVVVIFENGVRSIPAMRPRPLRLGCLHKGCMSG